MNANAYPPDKYSNRKHISEKVQVLRKDIDQIPR